MSNKVFVYGTLKRDEPNHHWLTDPNNGIGKFVGEGTTQCKYPLVITTRYNIPFLMQSPGNGKNIKGEVYEVDDTMLSKLDILEGYPDYYIRAIDDIIVKNPSTNESETLKCWVYFLKSFKPHLLEQPHLESYSSNGPHGLKFSTSTSHASLIAALNDVM